jgi:perosamine synthetase
MYVSSGPGLDPRRLVAPASAEVPPFPLDVPEAVYFSRARNALYHLVRALIRPGDRVLVPDYHGGNEILAIRAAGATVRYYPIHRDLRPDLDEVERLCRDGARVLLAIHFMGWPQPIRDLVRLCHRYGVVVVEDCAPALLSEIDGQPLGSVGDFAVFCLSTTLPLPNGAVLVQNRTPLPFLGQVGLRPGDLASVAWRSAELMAEWIRHRADWLNTRAGWLERTVGRLLPPGGSRSSGGALGFDVALADVAMSKFSRWLLPRLAYPEIRRRRRRNFAELLERLRGTVDLVIDRLGEGACPLFFPILVPDKRAAAQALRQRGVAAVEFWNYGDPIASGPEHADAMFLRRHVLQVPIHQDVSSVHLEHVASEVTRLAASWRWGWDRSPTEAATPVSRFEL